ncbi:Aldose 1-epimerase [Blattella germanica]|nr:Aldose 1-epimerase [Blattella germanica]
MEVYSDQPGVQLYTANFLPNTCAGDSALIGKNGAKYMKHGAFCLETQNFPDAVNHDMEQDCINQRRDVEKSYVELASTAPGMCTQRRTPFVRCYLHKMIAV